MDSKVPKYVKNRIIYLYFNFFSFKQGTHPHPHPHPPTHTPITTTITYTIFNHVDLWNTT